MRRRSHPYTSWEDYQAGMFMISERIDEHTALACELLSSPLDFEDAATAMIDAWPIAAEHNLTADGNRRAWIGAAACCWLHGCAEHTVRSAWWSLDVSTQVRANWVADRVINRWERERSDAQTLFG